MPDARQMSGIPMPSPDVPAGSVSVRLVRGDLSNNIVGHDVELHAGGRVLTVKTDGSGRALFSGIADGEQVQAVAVVDQERLQSQPFALPAGGGVRLVLVAGAGASVPGLASPAAAAGSLGGPRAGTASGEVAFAGDSRIQIEFDDDSLEVFYLFDLVNPAGAPVRPKEELAFQLPEGAGQPSALEGSSAQVSMRGRLVTISGPIAPGVTPVRLAYSLEPAGPDRVILQALPVAWERVQVIMAHAGQARIGSPQFTSVDEATGTGQPFVLATGGALAANQALTLSLSGLPSRSHVGRNLSLALGLIVLLAGALSLMRPGAEAGDAGRRAQLSGRRDKLMADLVRLEEQFRARAVDAQRYAARREDLIGQLARVYGELDSRAGGPGEA